MIITNWIEKVGKALITSNEETQVILSASSPFVIQQWIRDFFKPNSHDAAVLLRFRNSKYVLFIMSDYDIPMYNIIDPSTGKYLIKYELEETTTSVIRIS